MLALSPSVIADLIRDELEPRIDAEAWRKQIAREQRGRKLLDAAAASWTEVEKVLAPTLRKGARS